MFDIGTYCIHKSKWESRSCRVVAYDGDSVVIKHLGGGYKGVPEMSLTQVSKDEACSIALKAAYKSKGIGKLKK